MQRRRGIVVAAAVCAWTCAPVLLAQPIEVEISGVGGELESNVRARLSIADLAERAATESEASPEAEVTERRIRQLHEDAHAEIRRALRPFGYYEPTVSSSLERDEGEWTARYEIERGEPVRIDVVDVSVTGPGGESNDVREALREIPLARGDVLRHDDYESFKRGLFDAAYNAGYLDAEYERAELRVRPAARQADVHLVLDTGARHYFGEIRIEQSVLDPSFMERFVPVEAGEPFDTDRLIDLQVALGDSGYFSEVVVDALREEASNRRIPVRVSTTPLPNQEFTVGAGYGTDTGPRLRLGVELRRLNRRGHRFRFDSRISALGETLTGEYRIPVRDLATDYVSYRASLGREEIGGFETSQRSLEGSWNDLWRDIQRRFYVVGRREDFDTGAAPTRSARAVYPGARLSAQRADDPVFPREGHAWSVDLRGSVDALASTSFVRLQATGDYITSLGERGRLLLRGEYGAMRVGDFERLPPSQRFFAGGDDSVRGYAYQALGPTNAEGATVGGRYVVSASVELEYRFVENYGAAVFFDAGNAADEPWPDLQRSVGLGVRWRSPVGMLRVDLAHPLDASDEDWRLHLSIGSAL